MRSRRLILILFIFLLCPFAWAEGDVTETMENEKVVYVSLEVEQGGELLRSRIMKEVLLQLSLVKKAHFIMLDKGQGKTLNDSFSQLYYLRLRVSFVQQDKAKLEFTLFNENSKETIKKVQKEDIEPRRLFTLSKAAMRIVLAPLLGPSR